MKDFLFRSLPTRARSAGSLLLVVLCASVLTFGALFYLWQRFQFVSLGFEVSELRQRKARLEEQLAPLKVEVEYLSRLERIDALARNRLGMRPPRPSQIKIIEEHETPSLSSP